jgi:hypothetical protein
VSDNPEPIEIPADLAALSGPDLDALETSALAEFDRLAADEELDAPGLARLTALADGISAMRADRERRSTEAAEATAARDALRQRIHGDTTGSDDQADADAGQAPAADTQPAAPAAAAPAGDATPAPQLAEAIAAAVTAALTATAGHYSPARTEPVTAPAPRLNPTLADIAAHAPAVQAPEGQPRDVMVAGTHIPGYENGVRITSRDQMVTAFMARARALPDAKGSGMVNRMATFTVQRNRRHVLELNASQEQTHQALTAAIARGAHMESLVASGGWCAPNERYYDFFNIVDSSGVGMLDLPTISVSRGGIEWPVSPSFSDVVANSPALWTWNETQDIAAATGTAQSGSKTCVHVPCVTTAQARMDCDGLCVTAGNLQRDAWPESVDNFLSTLQSGYEHRVNSRRIQQLVTGSTSVAYSATGVGVVAPILAGLELQAIDYRSKFRMAPGAPLECALPFWVRGAMRADLMRRSGVDMLSVADDQLMAMLNALGLRVQWLVDWQANANGYPGQSAAATAWPSTVQALLFAPGTWVLGEGLELNLGIIRDSTLNATNDFTLAWMEECWLMAKFGHESRNITIPICPNGVTGALSLTACQV